MTEPFRDPIIYPGSPERTRTWTTERHRVCALVRHPIRPGTEVQRDGRSGRCDSDCR